jgi:ribonucleases P/MRP protein subunit RPP40
MTSLKIYYQNVRGLKTKLNDFYLSLIAADYDIVCLTETWLNPTIRDPELFDDRYIVYRSDRDFANDNRVDGGGSLIAVKKKFSSTRLMSYECVNNDVWISLKLQNSTCLLVNNVYLEFGSPFEVYESYFNNLMKIYSELPLSSELFILGDFNLPGITWTRQDSIMAPTDYEGRASEALCQTMSFCGLSQFMHVLNSNSRILDLVLTTKNANEVDVKPSSDILSKIDNHHPPIDIYIHITKQTLLKCDKSQTLYKFKFADYQSLTSKLEETDWTFLDTCDVQEAVSKFYSILYDLIDKFVPKFKYRQSEYPPWFSFELITLSKLKSRLHRNADQEEFKELRKKVKYMTRIAYSDFIKATEVSIHSQPKKFWNYSKNMKAKGCIPSEMKFEGVTETDPTKISNLFANFFRSVYVNDNSQIQTEIEPVINDTLSSIHIDQLTVLKHLTNIQTDKGSGPDKIPPIFVKQTATALATPLTKIFNQSLKHGLFPSEWKISSVVPIHKGGDAHDVTNYRPICLLSVFSKIFEKIMHEIVMAHVKSALNPKQHGFRASKSTLSNLLEYTDYITKALNDSAEVDSIYTDFAKAFDKVRHDILLLKLKSFGIHGNMLRWFHSYLYSRSQYVSVNGYKSTLFSPTSGVPQGSTLGPLLFLLFINDISKKFNCNFLLFADDLKLFLRIENDRSRDQLQADCDSLFEWCSENHLRLNVSKCKTITFGRSRISSNRQYFLNDTPIDRVESTIDLGITFDAQFRFDSHVRQITNQAHKLLGFIMRLTHSFTMPFTMKVLYFAYVRNKLEYLSTIWNPGYDVYIQLIEAVQRKFTRILNYRFRSPPEEYPDRLTRYSLTTLEQRRVLSDEIVLYKIVNGIIETDTLAEFNFRFYRNNVRERQFFAPPISRNNIRSFSPLVRLQRRHNQYFLATDLASPISAFKNSAYESLREFRPRLR